MFRCKYGLILSVFFTFAAASPVLAVSIPVNNPSFTGPSTTSWTGSGTYGADTGAGTNHPFVDGAGAYLRYDSSYLKQTLSETIDSSKIYTLTIDTVRAYDTSSWGSRAELYAFNGTVETRIRAVGYGATSSWNPLSIQVSGAELAAYAGQNLGVKITGHDNSDRGHYDNVRVEKSDVLGIGYQAPSSITIPNWTFSDGSGGYDQNWTLASGATWQGNGWRMTGGSYSMPNLDGAFAVNSTYQLLSDTFVEGARYTLTAQTGVRINASGDDGVLALYSSDLPISTNNASSPSGGGVRRTSIQPYQRRRMDAGIVCLHRHCG